MRGHDVPLVPGSTTYSTKDLGTEKATKDIPTDAFSRRHLCGVTRGDGPYIGTSCRRVSPNFQRSSKTLIYVPRRIKQNV